MKYSVNYIYLCLLVVHVLLALVVYKKKLQIFSQGWEFQSVQLSIELSQDLIIYSSVMMLAAQGGGVGNYVSECEQLA